MSSDMIMQILFMTLGVIVSLISSMTISIGIDWLERRRLRLIWGKKRNDLLLEEITKLEKKMGLAKRPAKNEGDKVYALVLLFGNVSIPEAAFFGTLVAVFGKISERAFHWVAATPWNQLVDTIVGTTVLVIGTLFRGVLEHILDILDIDNLRNMLKALRSHADYVIFGISYTIAIVLLVDFELIMIVTAAKLLQFVAVSYLLDFWKTLFAVCLPFLAFSFWQVSRRENQLRRLKRVYKDEGGVITIRCTVCGEEGHYSCTTVQCTVCGGKGYLICQECFDFDGSGKCKACSGTGHEQSYIQGVLEYEPLCKICHGSGICTECGGSGRKTCNRCYGKGREKVIVIRNPNDNI